MDKKHTILFIVDKLKDGWDDKEIISTLSIPRRTYYYWKDILSNRGLDFLLEERKRGPKPKEFNITDSLSRKIVTWRKKYGWGPVTIEGHLEKHFGVHIPHNRIYQLFVKEKLNNPIDYTRKTWGKTRFERRHSNSLWQADWKICNDDNWMITFLDDHSRFITASNKFWSPNESNSIMTLEKGIDEFGKPKQILTDRGTTFFNNLSKEPSGFTQFCIDNKIKHIVASIRRPTTIGKMEAFHGLYDKEITRFKSHEKYIEYWNYHRPHSAIGYLYPCEVYFRDRVQ